MSRGDDKDIEDGIWGVTRMVIACAAGIFLFCLAAAAIHAKVLPWFNDMQTEGTEHSYTFVQTKKELLVKLGQDVAKIDAQAALHASEPAVTSALAAQRAATIDRIRSEAASIPAAEIPTDIQRYLR